MEERRRPRQVSLDGESAARGQPFLTGWATRPTGIALEASADSTFPSWGGEAEKASQTFGKKRIGDQGGARQRF